MKEVLCIFSDNCQIVAELRPAKFSWRVERWGFHLIWRRETQFASLIFVRSINFTLGSPWFTRNACFVDASEERS